MSDATKDVEFSLKVMVNKQKMKVVFAEVDSSFADLLFSFLTLPLGRIVRILKNHYGDEAPAFGSFTTLYNGLSNLDSHHFWTLGAKSILLHPRSSSDAHCIKLKLDISDSLPVEYFVCEMFTSRFESISMYYDNIGQCRCCGSDRIKKEAAEKDRQSSDGVFTISRGSFMITDNLQIVSVTGLSEIFRVLSTSDIKNGELTTVTFGFAEVMDLLKASLISSTPLSDVILKKTGQVNSTTKQHGFTGNHASTSNSKKKMINLKMMVQKSTNKLLYAESGEDFVEFLFSLLVIPLGGVECLLSRNSSIKAIENLYKSVADIIDDKYFKNHDAKERLIKPKIPHGYVSENYILPLTQQSLPEAYKECYWKPSLTFPKGQGNYISGPLTYKVEDDLTVTPFCVASIISYLNELKIPISDVNELQLEIGLEEGLSILKASLTSTSALTDALLINHTANKRPNQEQA